MKRMLFAGSVMLLALQGHAGVLDEDFENSAYVVGNTVASGGILLVEPDTASGSTTIMTSTLGGTKSASIVDASGGTASQTRVGFTNAALTALNSETGIQQGSVQVDFKYGFADGTWEISILDDLDPANNYFTVANSVATFVSTAGALSVYSNTGTVASGITLTPGTAYRFEISFDNTTQKAIYEVRSNSPSYDQLLWQSEAVNFRSADTAIKGVRYLGFWTNNAFVGTNEIDNIIITDDNAVPAPEVAVSVDSVEIANGGTIDFGTPEPGITQETTVRVTNSGAADLTTSALAITGEGFALKAGEALEATIASGGFDEFVIELNSAAEGVKTGTLSFTSNDSDEASVSINLTGDVGNTDVEDWQER